MERLNYEEQSAGGEGDIHVRFVAPPLRRTFIQELSEDNSKVEMETPVSFDEIIGEDSNIILYARPEYGRTTLLRELRFRSLEKANEIRFPRIPALLDFATIGSTADAMLRSVRNHVELLPDGHDIESLLKLGHVTLMIDDVQFDDRGKIRALGEFVKRYPKARYILSSPQYSATH